MSRVALFPGSFDPFTKGHQDIVLRGLELFDRIIIGIGYNSSKSQRYFSVDLMTSKIEEAFVSYSPRVSVRVFSELTAVFAHRSGARYLLRGLRNTTDFEFENSIAQVNKHLVPGLETVFLITSPRYASIRSSIVREVHGYQGDVSEFLPYVLE